MMMAASHSDQIDKSVIADGAFISIMGPSGEVDAHAYTRGAR